MNFLLGIIIITSVVSLIAFENSELRNRFIFNPYAIIQGKEHYRLLTSGLIHGSLIHLFFNMYCLHSFGKVLLKLKLSSAGQFLAMYIICILAGGLMSLAMNHRNSSYLALGASGGTCGVILASVMIMPEMPIGIIFIPIAIPGWIFTIAFLAYTFHGMKNKRDMIGHDAHLGGGMAGMLFALIFFFKHVKENLWIVAVLSLAIVAGFGYIHSNKFRSSYK